MDIYVILLKTKKGEKMKQILNMVTAFFIYPFLKFKFKNRNIWLVGGNAGELYVDNGKAMFEYLNTKEDLEVYWVINAGSPAFNDVKGNKLLRGSVKAYLYFMNSKVSLFSHSISADIVPYLFVVPLINRFHYKVTKVFLNHGTVGLKKRQPMNPKLEKLINKLIKSYDINTADAEYEKKIKNLDWGIDERKIHITGSPRYDSLEKETSFEKDRIFFMPTWRPWLKDNENIEKTAYFQNITGLISNDKLQDFLRENGVELRIYIHQLMHKYLKEFRENITDENVILLPKEADIQNEIMTSRLLITDYSSISFDFFYIDKSVLFFQFDKAEYNEKVGAYIDLEKDLFGPAAFDINSCVTEIMRMYKENFQIEDDYKKMKDSYFKYNDKGNSERLFKIIEGEIIGKRKNINNNSAV